MPKKAVAAGGRKKTKQAIRQEHWTGCRPRDLKLAAISLGCIKNRIDTEEVLGGLARQGFVLTDDHYSADIVLINTCSFIEKSQQESIQTILKIAAREKGRPLLIAAGCLVELSGSKILKTIPEIDGAIGVHSYSHLRPFINLLLNGRRPAIIRKPAELCPPPSPRVLTTAPHSQAVKIAEGCSNCCHYCLIPAIRGSCRSRTVRDITAEIETLLDRGAKEITLVAQDTTAYGRDRGGLPGLGGLVEEIMAIKKYFWLRIMYAYPSRIDSSLIGLIASEPRICSYIDMPIQHASDAVLAAMGRHYRRSDLEELVTEMRRNAAGLALRTTCMIGHPGESRQNFLELLDFISRYPFDRLGAFTYSRQQGTASAAFTGRIIPARVSAKRLDLLMSKQRGIALKLNRRLIGTKALILIDKLPAHKGGPYFGRTEFQAPEVDGWVYIVSAKALKVGSFVEARIVNASPYNLLAVDPVVMNDPLI